MPAGHDDEVVVQEWENQCANCVRLNRQNPVTCEAFPEGIPLMILLGAFNHRNPYEYEGVTDNGLHYAPVDDEGVQSIAETEPLDK